MQKQPRILVFTTVFPNEKQPNFGIFVRERMVRVAKELPVQIVAPIAWFPMQGLIRKFVPHFRPQPAAIETFDGVTIYHPRFLCVPGIFKSWDGFLLALSSYFFLKKLSKTFDYQIIDAHFAYPDGYAASLLARWLKKPFTVTLRGTEVPHSRVPKHNQLMQTSLNQARAVFSVSNDLIEHVQQHCHVTNPNMQRIGNGIDIEKFYPLDKQACRQSLNITPSQKVLISIGGLCERKGFHRTLEALPPLLEKYPDLLYLIVGGAGPAGDWTERLQTQIKQLGLENHVRMTGPIAHAQLKNYLSASDVFVLSTRMEGWANVFLEAMACGLPVVTTRVGGNHEVVANSDVGILVDFDVPAQLTQAMLQALAHPWSAQTIIQYARDNSWDNRIDKLVKAFQSLLTQP